MITEQQQLILEMPFNVDEHDFVNGNVFLKKSAIRRRLSMVDSGWESTSRQLVTASDDLVVYQGGLTVCGVTRYAIGTGIILRTKTVGPDKKKVPLEDFELARSIAKAHKAADSDIMARAAVPFGIGAYLKSMPKGINDTNTLAKWLAVLNKPVVPAPAPQPPTPPSPVQPPTPTPAPTLSGQQSSDWWNSPVEQKIVTDATGYAPGAAARKLNKTLADFPTSEDMLAAWKKHESEKGSVGASTASRPPQPLTGESTLRNTPGNGK